MRRFSPFILLMVTFAPTHVDADAFQIVGLRPLAMGGAYVAVADGALASYWNPAALAYTRDSGFETPVSVRFQTTPHVLQTIDPAVDASDKASAISKNGTPSLADAATFRRALTDIKSLNEPGNGALVGINTGLESRHHQVAFSVNNFTAAGATPFVDTTVRAGVVSGLRGDATLANSSDVPARDTLAASLSAVQANAGLVLPAGVTPASAANRLVNEARRQGYSGAQITDFVAQAELVSRELTGSGLQTAAADNGDPLDVNRSNVVLRGASMTEFSLGYGTSLPLYHWYGDLAIGTNLKLIRGDIAFRRVSATESSLAGLPREFAYNYRTTYQPGIDLGIYWIAPTRRRWQVGLLGRNLNAPLFNQPDFADPLEPSYRLSPQIRLGTAYFPHRHWMLAADLDVTRNSTGLVANMASRQLSLGAEWHRRIWALRAGVLQELATNPAPSYTFGVGMLTRTFRFDFGALLQPDFVTVGAINARIPAHFQVGLSLGARFGLPKPRKDRRWVHVPDQASPDDDRELENIEENDLRTLQQLPGL